MHKLHTVDTSIAPEVRQIGASDPLAGKYCIDFQPETVPSIAPFETEQAAHTWLAETFGIIEHKRWFPNLYNGTPYATWAGCGGYKPQREMKRGRLVQPHCASCRAILRSLV